MVMTSELWCQNHSDICHATWWLTQGHPSCLYSESPNSWYCMILEI